MYALDSAPGLRALDSLHMFVGDLSRSREHYVERLGFRQAGLSGAELEAEQATRVSMLESGDVRLLLMAPLGARSVAAGWLAQHAEGIGRIVLEVDDTRRAREQLAQRGAQLLGELEERKTGFGRTCWFDVATPFGALTLRLVQYQDCRKVLPGLVCRAPRKVAFGSFGVGHIVRLRLGVADGVSVDDGARWLCELLGFDRVEENEAACLLRHERAGLELVIAKQAAQGVDTLTLAVANLTESHTIMGEAGVELGATDQGYQLASVAHLSNDPRAAALTIELRGVASARPAKETERAA